MLSDGSFRSHLRRELLHTDVDRDNNVPVGLITSPFNVISPSQVRTKQCLLFSSFMLFMPEILKTKP